MRNETLLEICIHLKWITALLGGVVVAIAAYHFGIYASLLTMTANVVGFMAGAVCILTSTIRVYGDPNWLRSLHNATSEVRKGKI